MERDELIIWVYLWVCEGMKGIKASCPNGRLRRSGFDPALSDEEALTIELCGEMLRLTSDKAIFNHFKAYYASWFPALKNRSAFVRQCANLWRVKEILQQQLLQHHSIHHHLTGETRVQPVDTMPLPVCARVRANRDRCFAGVARVGYCAAKKMSYYGFKLGLRITEHGLISCHRLLSANTNDCRHLPALVENYQGFVPVDKGFFDPVLWKILWKKGVHIVGHGPERVDHHRPPEVVLSDFWERHFALLRKTVEVVASLLCGRFNLDRIRVHDLWHFEHRLLRKVLAFNLLVSLNMRLGRTPLDLDGLVGD